MTRGDVMHINDDALEQANKCLDGLWRANPNVWEVICADGEIIPCKNEGTAMTTITKLATEKRAAIMRKRPKMERK